ncbi:hypothetical protein [Meridianimarinicoccus roseus]|uniref:hypothetical protein n=1 Tax=Meridianimarinicoccus roseus TaxID=2072018 RepID=UPI001EE63A14|nr:hypothetical protein [Meridianimarinicoccus roseus]
MSADASRLRTAVSAKISPAKSEAMLLLRSEDVGADVGSCAPCNGSVRGGRYSAERADRFPLADTSRNAACGDASLGILQRGDLAVTVCQVTENIWKSQSAGPFGEFRSQVAVYVGSDASADVAADSAIGSDFPLPHHTPNQG